MTIAILAHDSRKELALQFCTAYSGILSRNTVIATGTTGRMLNQATGLPVHCYLSGKLGGIQQITARVACDEVHLVLFFRDPFKLTPLSAVAEIADKFTRNEIMTSNEFRQAIGMKPSKDPKADELRNANISQSSEEIAAQNKTITAGRDAGERSIANQNG